MKPVDVIELLNVKMTLTRLNIASNFDARFLRSITKEEKIKNKHFDSFSYYYKGYKKQTFLSEKQFNVYKGILKKFKSVNVYERYTDYFKIKNIELSDYDKGYFETFVDDLEETDGFKKWLQEIINY